MPERRATYLHHPDTGRIGAVAKRCIGRIDQRLATLVDENAIAHTVHIIAEAHMSFRIGKTDGTARARMTECSRAEAERRVGHVRLIEHATETKTGIG